MGDALRRLGTAADANLVVHFTWVQRQTSGMHVVDEDDLVLTDCGLACDTFNAALRARLEERSASRRIREAVDWFASRGHPFSWWVGPSDSPARLGALLEQAGLVRAESELAMAADLSRLRPPDASTSALDIRRVRTGPDLETFARINAANWTPPDAAVERFYRLAAPALLAPSSPLWLYVGYAGDVAVGTAELTIGGGVVGLYNIATLAAHRRRGYGTAMTLRALRDARDAGHDTAILQAAPDGVGVYRRVGFGPFGEITEYKPR